MTTLPKLGIIAGGGTLPAIIADVCKQQKRECFILGLEGVTHPETLKHAPHALVRLGALEVALNTLHKNNVLELVMAGPMKRPNLASLQPDPKAMGWLTKLGAKLLSGDDSLLSSVIKLLEIEGFKVIGADDVVKDLLTPEGVLTKTVPTPEQKNDITLGIKEARTHGALDLGQAIIIENGELLGVEDERGTAALIERCATKRQGEKSSTRAVASSAERAGKSGILVKTKKPKQERRADLPTIGLETVRQIADAGFAGIAIEAGESLLMQRKEMLEEANKAGIFVVGFR